MLYGQTNLTASEMAPYSLNGAPKVVHYIRNGVPFETAPWESVLLMLKLSWVEFALGRLLSRVGRSHWELFWVADVPFDQSQTCDWQKTDFNNVYVLSLFIYWLCFFSFFFFKSNKTHMVKRIVCHWRCRWYKSQISNHTNPQETLLL